MLYVSSDHHFGHEEIIQSCRRPFSSVEEMNEIMLERLNDRVKSSDTLFLLGDFLICKKRKKFEYFNRLRDLFAKINCRLS